MTFNVLLQYILPHRALSRVVYWATRWTFKPWKNFLISTIVRNYQVNMAEAAQPDPLAYQHFNAFFTRKLRQDARRADADAKALLSPADGKISQLGKIVDGRIFSVAPFAVEAIPRLFARNERLVCHFEGERGPFVVVMVGAILVSSVATVWDGLVIPPYASSIRRKSFVGQNITLDRFAEMARFNMGSTVIMLFPEGMVELDQLASQQHVQVGQRLGVEVGG